MLHGIANFGIGTLERDDFCSNRHPAPSHCFARDLFRKPVPTFRDHALIQQFQFRSRRLIERARREINHRFIGVTARLTIPQMPDAAFLDILGPNGSEQRIAALWALIERV